MRRNDGRETWHRLLNWDKAQAPAERLAGLLLHTQKYQSLDPSHPLGGKDSLKDILCVRDGRQWIGAVYFPRGQLSFKETKEKFQHDLVGVKQHSAAGIAFVTNQELRLAERSELEQLAGDAAVDLFHLERIASILNSPECYGLRLEFLDIEMTREEQLAFIACRDKLLSELSASVSVLVQKLNKQDGTEGEKKQIQTVQPQLIGGTMSSSILFGPVVHECKKCGEVFLVEQASMFFSFMPHSHTVVTCPSCGRTERFAALP